MGRYELRATAYSEGNKGGDQLGTLAISFTVAASDLAPSNLSGQVVDDGVSLTWTAPADDADSVTGYEIQRAVGDGDFAFLWEDTQSTATAHTDATATEAGQTYRYSVTALRGSDKSDWSVEVSATLPPPAGLTPAELPNTLLGYSESEGAGTLEPNEVTIDDESFRVTNASIWPGVAGLVLFLTAGTSEEDAALAGTDFILEADEYVLVVGTTEFSFDDVSLTHSDTTGEGGEYTGVVSANWLDGEPGLTAGETVAFGLERRDRPEPAHPMASGPTGPPCGCRITKTPRSTPTRCPTSPATPVRTSAPWMRRGITLPGTSGPTGPPCGSWTKLTERSTPTI